MIEYTSSVDLGSVEGKEEATMTIVVTGCDCMVQDAQMEIAALLRDLQKQMKERRGRIVKKPCGCGEK